MDLIIFVGYRERVLIDQKVFLMYRPLDHSGVDELKGMRNLGPKHTEHLTEKLENCAKVVAMVSEVDWTLLNMMKPGFERTMTAAEASSALADG